MSLIEGVGDEVTVCFGIFTILSLMILAWLFTHVSDPIIRVIVLDRDAFRRLIQRIRNIQSGGAAPVQTNTNDPMTSETHEQEEEVTSPDTQTRVATEGENVSESVSSEPISREEQVESTTVHTVPPPITGTDDVPAKTLFSSESAHSSVMQTNDTDVSASTGPVETNNTGGNDVPISKDDSEEEAVDVPEGSIRIKIKYLDDRQKIVYAKPDITLGKFKRYAS